MKKRWADGERWLGGYVRVRGGVATFYIERRLHGERFHVCTRCHSEAQAQKQLARFEANPFDYDPGGDGGARVLMTGKLLADFNAWQTSGPDAVSHKHALYTAKYLADWMKAIGKRDLRALKLHELKKALDRWAGARHLRIAALKVFFAWLREEEGLLKHSEDVTLNLAVPQARPEQRRRQKAIPYEWVEAALPHLPSDAERDAVLVLSATGWHVEELGRFAKSGEVSPGDGATLAVIAVKHKNGEIHLTRLQQQVHVDAAKRLLERGRAPHRLSDKLGRASVAAGLPRFTAGIFRHSKATWAHQAGASLDDVARFLGHKDRRTTAKFYIDMREAPAAVPAPIATVH